MRRRYRGLGRLWISIWLVICAVIGDLFAERHYALGAAALAGVVWACIRWTRPVVPQR